jgi:hypothetical protein
LGLESRVQGLGLRVSKMHHLSAATYLLYDRFMLPLRAEGFRV